MSSLFSTNLFFGPKFLYDHRVSIISDKLYSTAHTFNEAMSLRSLPSAYGYKECELASAIDPVNGAVDRGDNVFWVIHVLISGYSPSR
jgi:hypothetical protein